MLLPIQLGAGVFRGKVGLVPRRFIVDPEDEAEVAAEVAAKPVIKRCRAIRPYQGPAGHLNFTYGDIILVPRIDFGDYWEGVFKVGMGGTSS